MTELREMPCVEFVEQVTDYLEGALGGPDLARLEAHLEACSHCAHYLEQLRVVHVRAGQIVEADLTPSMRRELLGAFTKWQSERAG